MKNPQLGNRVILLVLAALLAVAALFAPWGAFKFSPGGVKPKVSIEGLNNLGADKPDLARALAAMMFDGELVTATGLNGNLSLGTLQIPFWLVTFFVFAACVITLLNGIGFSNFSRGALVTILILGIIAGVWATIVFQQGGEIRIGPILLIASAAIALGQQSLPRSEGEPPDIASREFAK